MRKASVGMAALVASTHPSTRLHNHRRSTILPSPSSRRCRCRPPNRRSLIRLGAASRKNLDLETSSSFEENQQHAMCGSEVTEDVTTGTTTTLIINNNNNNTGSNTANTTATTTVWPDLLSSSSSSSQSPSVLLLNAVAILWGTQHAIIKTVVLDSVVTDDTTAVTVTGPGPFTLLRFGMAALLASPYTPGLLANCRTSNNRNDMDNCTNNNNNASDQDHATSTIKNNKSHNTIAPAWRWGIEMGWWMFLGFSFQAIGLQYTSAQKSGFLLYLNVKFVPFLARILLGREISMATWVSAVVAFVGTALLAINPAEQQQQDAWHELWNVGDLWSIAAAMASAMFILRLERASAAVPNAAALNAACLWVVVALAAVWTLVQPSLTPLDAAATTSATTDIGSVWSSVVAIATSHPWEMIYLSGVTTTLANWIQSKAQRNITAERASVIYAMDPVYGAVFSSWLLGESLNGVQGWIGAGMITVAAATNAFLDLSSKTPDKHGANQTSKETA